MLDDFEFVSVEERKCLLIETLYDGTDPMSIGVFRTNDGKFELLIKAYDDSEDYMPIIVNTFDLFNLIPEIEEKAKEYFGIVDPKDMFGTLEPSDYDECEACYVLGEAGLKTVKED